MSVPAVAGASAEVRTRAGWARVRIVALCSCYAVLSLWAIVMSSFGTLTTVLGRLPDESWTFGALSAAAFKMLTLGPVLVVLASRGRSVLAVRALVVGQLVWLVVDLIAPEEPTSPGELLLRYAVSMTLWVGPWLLLSENRTRLWLEPLRVRPLLLAVPGLVGVVCLPWVVANGALDATIQTSVGTSAELRSDVVGVPVAIVAALAVCALASAPWWDRAVAIALVWVAFASVVSPDGYGSPGYAGSLFAVVAALVVWATRSSARHA